VYHRCYDHEPLLPENNVNVSIFADFIAHECHECLLKDLCVWCCYVTVWRPT
uniref:Uncharacterized protein n=1 Tax=Nothobranchius furzeri TaxID=105023 RepID=A0A8C6KNE5_NOTFU